MCNVICCPTNSGGYKPCCRSCVQLLTHAMTSCYSCYQLNYSSTSHNSSTGVATGKLTLWPQSPKMAGSRFRHLHARSCVAAYTHELYSYTRNFHGMQDHTVDTYGKTEYEKLLFHCLKPPAAQLPQCSHQRQSALHLICIALCTASKRCLGRSLTPLITQ